LKKAGADVAITRTASRPAVREFLIAALLK
jgi:hypothetical protein